MRSASGKVTLIFRLTTSGGSGIVSVTVPVSPTTTVTDAACKEAPDERVPAGADGVAPATVVEVVEVVGDCPLVHVGGQTLSEATDKVKLIGPDGN